MCLLNILLMLCSLLLTIYVLLKRKKKTAANVVLLLVTAVYFLLHEHFTLDAFVWVDRATIGMAILFVLALAIRFMIDRHSKDSDQGESLPEETGEESEP